MKNKYMEEFCENCKHNKGIIDLGIGNKKMKCGKYGLIGIRNQPLTVSCFENRKEIIFLKPNIYGIGIDLKEIIKKLFKKV